MMKTCTKCGEAKPVAGFHKKTKAKDGLNPSCRTCVSQHLKLHYRENSERIKKRVSDWVRSNPEKVRAAKRRYYLKNAESFKARAKNWAHENRKRRLEILRASDARRAEQRREYAREYYSENLSKSREDVRRRQALRRASGNVSAEWWQAIFDFVETGVCVFCGAHGRRLTMDHWIPVSRGGKTEVGNLVPCCKSCNSRKGAKTPDEWKSTLGVGNEAQIGLSIEQFLQCSREAFEESERDVEIVK